MLKSLGHFLAFICLLALPAQAESLGKAGSQSNSEAFGIGRNGGGRWPTASPLSPSRP